jgi:hypothetical protein
MYLLCSLTVVTGFILVAIVGIYRVLTDLLAMSEGGAALEHSDERLNRRPHANLEPEV